ncbi:hypothetical protein E2C01_093449 [Portunus trituberculatus]|uniref:Uncharacterized protein n=1 Tax=Portunus trituberculatus TaxID=210409 RepID=A0A5B7JYB0_PORTR|nr:hypothetical protein [Portunus trituberculatus]
MGERGKGKQPFHVAIKSVEEEKEEEDGEEKFRGGFRGEVVEGCGGGVTNLLSFPHIFLFS